MNEQNLEHRIYQNKLAFVYSELPKSVLATLFLGLILVMILKEDVSIDRLAVWYGLTILLSVLRLVSFFYFRSHENKERSIDKDARLLFLGTLLSGFLWGVSSLYIFPQSDELKFILLFFIAGLSAGATGVFAPIFKVYVSFVLVMIIPFIIVFTLESSSYSLFISVSLLFYLIVISSTALKINHNYDETLRLRFKNDTLVQELKHKAELAEQASKAKGLFLSRMSHEIRTPLNAILGYISLLRKKEKDADKQEKLQIIDHSSHLLLGVINDILDYSKISTGGLKLDYIACDLKEELKQLVKLFIPLFKEKGLIFTHEIDEDIPSCLMTDVLRVNQILSNLLSNAIKFTPRGKKVILKGIYKDDKVLFEVVDEGIGIDKEHQKIIFESFQQADNSISRKYGGTGLGLAISYQLSLLLKGELHVSSALGEGSTFSFCIDVKRCDKVSDKVSPEAVHFDGEKVLVAEDNMTNQMLIRLLLEDLGLVAEIVNDGNEAVQSYCDDFALVLMDINMPGMNGIEAMQAIKQKYPKANIIALTANALKEDKEEYLQLGFDDYLSKPIDTETLNRVLARILQENRSETRP